MPAKERGKLTNLRRVLLGMGLWLALGSTSLWAQSPYGQSAAFPRPVVSPYLNLLRQGNSPAFNYYTLVRPELDSLQALGQLNSQFSQAGAAQNAKTQEGEPITGHSFGFQTQRRYFMTMGGGGSSFRATGAVGNASAAPQGKAK